MNATKSMKIFIHSHFLPVGYLNVKCLDCFPITFKNGSERTTVLLFHNRESFHFWKHSFDVWQKVTSCIVYFRNSYIVDSVLYIRRSIQKFIPTLQSFCYFTLHTVLLKNKWWNRYTEERPETKKRNRAVFNRLCEKVFAKGNEKCIYSSRNENETSPQLIRIFVACIGCQVLTPFYSGKIKFSKKFVKSCQNHYFLVPSCIQ